MAVHEFVTANQTRLDQNQFQSQQSNINWENLLFELRHLEIRILELKKRFNEVTSPICKLS
jgi:hypothetical protein